MYAVVPRIQSRQPVSTQDAHGDDNPLQLYCQDTVQINKSNTNIVHAMMGAATEFFARFFDMGCIAGGQTRLCGFPISEWFLLRGVVMKRHPNIHGRRSSNSKHAFSRRRAPGPNTVSKFRVYKVYSRKDCVVTQPPEISSEPVGELAYLA